MQEFDGNVAVVTGAASGIGRALAHRFASEGMKLVIGDVVEDGLEETAQQLERFGTSILPVVVDVTSRSRSTNSQIDPSTSSVLFTCSATTRGSS